MKTHVVIALPDWFPELDPTQQCADDEAKLRFVIGLAMRNVEERTGGPFGAAIFDGDGRVIAAGVNRVLPETCSAAHAELLAMIGAQRRLGRNRLNGNGGRFVLATSAQPCCQCYGACVWSGIDELLIGARAEDVMALSEFDEGPLPADWIGELERRGIAVRRDILRDEACEVFRRYASLCGPSY
ncbi:MAG: nucleoside deaminase [Xanthomonadales bacterium]|nr:nucleoside deaminase [Xanthomonadales bacterium]